MTPLRSQLGCVVLFFLGLTVLKVFSLTRWKSPQRALDIQEHLVVVFVIVSFYGFWKENNKQQLADLDLWWPCSVIVR